LVAYKVILKLQKSRWDKIDLVVQHILGFFFRTTMFRYWQGLLKNDFYHYKLCD